MDGTWCGAIAIARVPGVNGTVRKQPCQTNALSVEHTTSVPALSNCAIVGIVIVSLAAACVVGLGIFLYVRKHDKVKSAQVVPAETSIKMVEVKVESPVPRMYETDVKVEPPMYKTQDPAYSV